MTEGNREAARLIPSLSRCPYCHEDVGRESEPVSVCAACMARHHAGCWREHGACSSCGARQRLVPRAELERPPAPPPAVAPPEDGRRSFLLACGVALSFTILVGLAVRNSERAHDADALAAQSRANADEAFAAAQRSAAENAALKARLLDLERQLALEKQASRGLRTELDAERARRAAASRPAPEPSARPARTPEDLARDDMVANSLLTARDDLVAQRLAEERRSGGTAPTTPAALASRAAAAEVMAAEHLAHEATREQAIDRLLDAHGWYQAAARRTDLQRIERAYWALVHGEDAAKVTQLLKGARR